MLRRFRNRGIMVGKVQLDNLNSGKKEEEAVQIVASLSNKEFGSLIKGRSRPQRNRGENRSKWR